jgi:hypothetical protein
MNGPTVLDAFWLPPAEVTWANYWRVILPGSKRYIGARTMVGDNSDVRPPAPAGQGGSNVFPRPEPLFAGDAIDSMTIDGVFFADGSFVVPIPKRCGSAPSETLRNNRRSRRSRALGKSRRIYGADREGRRGAYRTGRAALS